MGVSCSCPFAVHYDLENGFESIIVNLSDDKLNPESLLDSEQLLIERSVEFGTMVKSQNMSILDPNSPKHEAAVKLQKVYKSFRTRRQLADCAVLIEQSWWKLLDFAELKHSSISFFDIDKHETAVSRWSRARTRAAKVGKGLSKNGKARKLALQHWLEAIDPRHRYGHNLHFYYVKWLNSQSKEPFFYWLDIGEGKEVNLIEKCPRSKLQQQCIEYLGPMERKAYEIVMEDGKLFYKQTGELLDTTEEANKGYKWIFVLSTSRTLYVGKKKKGSFQHSSFLAGGATLAAGRIESENGVLKAVWPHSGHYRPTPENFQDFLSFLQENNVDLTHVKLVPANEEEESSGNKRDTHLRSNSSDENLDEKDCPETEENDSNPESDETISTEGKTSSQMPMSSDLHDLGKKLTTLEIPSKENMLEKLLMSGNQTDDESIIIINNNNSPRGSPTDGYETAEESFASKQDDDDEKNEEIIPEAHILLRINSHKDLNSFQLGKHLSCKWSTGAGPRIGCVRDYPWGLQCHALEQVNLSPSIKIDGVSFECMYTDTDGKQSISE